MIAAELRQELDKANFISVATDASKKKEQGRRRAGTLPTWAFISGKTGADVPLWKSIIGNLMIYQDRLQTYLLQL